MRLQRNAYVSAAITTPPAAPPNTLRPSGCCVLPDLRSTKTLAAAENPKNERPAASQGGTGHVRTRTPIGLRPPARNQGHTIWFVSDEGVSGIVSPCRHRDWLPASLTFRTSRGGKTDSDTSRR